MLSLSDKTPTIVTHSDTFHCDEVMGTAMLEYLYGENLTIVRTRDKDELTRIQNDEFSDHIVLDVGQIYDPKRRLYDHHQKSFTDKWQNHKHYKASTPLSSCGLVWKHHGSTIINKKLKELGFLEYFSDTMKDDFYYYFVHGIDANDNGISKYEQSGKARYSNALELGWVVNKFNSDNVYDNDRQMVQFRKAVDHCKEVLDVALEKNLKYSVAYLKDKPNFKTDYESKENSEILVVASRYECMNEYLHDSDPDQTTKFIIVPRGSDQKQIWTVNKKGSQFENLVKIIPQEKAKNLVGDKCVFVHKARFTGSFKDEESAIKVCEASLADHYSVQSTLGRVGSYFVLGLAGSLTLKNPFVIGSLGMVAGISLCAVYLMKRK